MTYSSNLNTRITHSVMQFVITLTLIALFPGAAGAHQLAVSPPQPTTESPITIIASGDWPAGGSPNLQQVTRNGQSIRIDTLGIIPGVQQPIVPYQLDIDIGRLPPGQYHVDYFIDVLAAPVSPPGNQPSASSPDASISFEVLTSPEPIPTLSAAANALLVILLLVATALSGIKNKFKRNDNQRLGTR